MKKIYNKLVRDKIPEQIMAEGKACLIRGLDDTEYLNALRTKLCEEYNEWVNAFGKEEEIEELADMLEVIDAIDDFYNCAICKRTHAKHCERGSFDKRFYLEYVIEEDEEGSENE